MPTVADNGPYPWEGKQVTGSGGGRLVVKRFPADVHQRLRMASAESGDDMRDIVIAGVKAELARRAADAALRARARAANPAKAQ